MVAKEVAERGLTVAVLEAGPRYRPQLDFINDEAEMMKLFSNNPLILDGKHPVMPAAGKGVGGGHLVYTAVCFRFHSSDFRTASLDGVGRDWPIAHDDLKPYYHKVEHDFGVAGLSHPPCDNLSPNYPMPPHPQNTIGLLIERGCKELGLQSIPGSMAINSTPYDGRDACVYCGFCIQGCANDAKASVLNSYIPKAERRGAVVLPHCTATRIVLNRQGCADRVLYVDAQGRRQEIAARLVVVSAHAVESPRLLLDSACTQFPEGLANRSGLVGKNFMAHILVFVHGKYPNPIDAFRGMSLGHRCYIDEYATQPGKEYVRGFVLESYMAPPMGFAMTSSNLWGQEFKDLFDQYRRFGGIFAVGESLPNDANTVTLDAEATDHLGRLIPRVTHAWAENDLKVCAAASQRAREIFDASGALETTTSSIRGAHYMGTCRMGANPDESVVNQFGQSHDIPNLFICDTSVFVTGGAANISLTTMALAQRAAEYMVEKMRRGDL